MRFPWLDISEVEVPPRHTLRRTQARVGLGIIAPDWPNYRGKPRSCRTASPGTSTEAPAQIRSRLSCGVGIALPAIKVETLHGSLCVMIFYTNVWGDYACKRHAI